MKIAKKILSFAVTGYALAFLHGVLISSMVVLLISAQYEDRLYGQLVSRLIEPNMDDRQKSLTLLHATHDLLKPRLRLFSESDDLNLRDALFRSSDIQLLDAKEGCGSHVHVLGKLLKRAGFKIRVAQMKCGQIWGCHIVLETKIDHRWVVLDALYDLYFEKPNGDLAGFNEVSQNWTYFKQQVPDNYYSLYDYEDVRYTNWQKIPIILPATKTILKSLIGNKIETFSFRVYLFNLYKTYLLLTIIIHSLVVLFTLLIIKKQRIERSRIRSTTKVGIAKY